VVDSDAAWAGGAAYSSRWTGLARAALPQAFRTNRVSGSGRPGSPHTHGARRRLGLLEPLHKVVVGPGDELCRSPASLRPARRSTMTAARRASSYAPSSLGCSGRKQALAEVLACVKGRAGRTIGVCWLRG
jgi:hypothetical protein